MSPLAEILFIWTPIVLTVVFVGHFVHRRVAEGLSALQVLSDPKFLMVFFYSGALLAIYLSTFHFFYTGLWPTDGN